MQKIWYGDALNYLQYNEADIIYYYRPIGTQEKQKELENKIENEIKKGGIIIASYKEDKEIANNKKFKVIAEEPWTHGLTYILQKK